MKISAGRSNASSRKRRYEVSLAERRYEHVDPAKRHVARELEARWNAALERVAVLERRIARLDEEIETRPRVDRDACPARKTRAGSAQSCPRPSSPNHPLQN